MAATTITYLDGLGHNLGTAVVSAEDDDIVCRSHFFHTDNCDFLVVKE